MSTRTDLPPIDGKSGANLKEPATLSAAVDQAMLAMADEIQPAMDEHSKKAEGINMRIRDANLPGWVHDLFRECAEVSREGGRIQGLAEALKTVDDRTEPVRSWTAPPRDRPSR